MKDGALPGETGIPQHIETLISNVFLFDTKAYKVYKDNNDFFNKEFRDLSRKTERFVFTEKDYVWNNTLSPSIYTALVGVRVENGTIHICAPAAAADELMIVMNRVDTRDILFEKLMSGQLSEDDVSSMGNQLAGMLQKVQKKFPSVYNYYHLFEARVAELRRWFKPAVEHVPEKEASLYLDFLDLFRERNREWFEQTLSDELRMGGDFHSNNALFSHGSFHLMDTFSPKEEWQIEHHLSPLYRIGTDIWALSGKKELFEAFIKGYEDGSGVKVNRALDPLHILYASGIALPYLYMLQRTDPAKKEAAERFHAFVRNYFESIENQ